MNLPGFHEPCHLPGTVAAERWRRVVHGSASAAIVAGMRRVGLSLVLLVVMVRAAAAAPEPRGKHPRIVLDAELRARWKKLAGTKGSAVKRSIERCEEVTKRPREFAKDFYMGLDWAQYLQACLVAWAATDKEAHAKTALVYFEAMLDDLEVVGDGKGGDAAARRDHGFAIRAMGPYTALAYDWLHDKIPDDVRKRARQRFAAWLDWYAENGYRPRSPGTNYHAGYLVSATLMAIAQGGEAGSTGTALWNKVVDDLWLGDMAKALARGGVLDGGDWGEGWQYGPLSVAEYALSARALRGAGVEIPGLDRWYEGLVRHNAYALSPGGGIYANGDSNVEPPTANLKPNLLAFAAPLIGGGPADAQAWAKAEIAALRLDNNDFPLYAALAEAPSVAATPLPRDQWPTTYLSAGVGTFYARSHWGRDGVWMVTTCTSKVDVDHIHPDSGNVVISRGGDDLIIDPSPYGTLSTLTSNAPTVESAQLPPDYKPSQAWWSEKTHYAWARQTASGIVATRCDYADQYKFQDRPSDVPEALRDIVLVPYAKGGAAAMVVIDRARSGAKDRELYLRFKSLAKLALSGDVATGKRGASQLTVRRVGSTSGKPEVRARKASDCFKEGITRGGCDQPRLDVDEYQLIVDGPAMSALHVIDVAAPAKAPPAVEAIKGTGVESGVRLSRDGRDAVVIDGRGKDLRYTAPRGDAVYHVIVGAPEAGGKAHVTATAADRGCDVAVSASGSGTAVDAHPVVIVLDAACKVSEDPSLTQPLAALGGVGPDPARLAGDGAGSDAVGDGRASAAPRSARSGCCGAQAAPGSPIAMAVIVGIGVAGLLRRPRRRR